MIEPLATKNTLRFSSLTAVFCTAIVFLSPAFVGCTEATEPAPPSENPVSDNSTNASDDAASNTASESGETSKAKREATATLAGGCFWCTEAVFERMEGVHDVVSGYIGGSVPNPTYQQVCSKLTGHAEAVEIKYDPDVVTFEELLEVFFKTHDPTTLNQQGADKGPQYRSSVFYHDAEQKKIAEKYIEKLNQAGVFNSKVVTQLEEATKFYVAEEYHQDYYRRNPNAGYCQFVVRNKVEKFNELFSDKAKKK